MGARSGILGLVPPFERIDRLVNGVERTAHPSLPHVLQPFSDCTINHRLRHVRNPSPLHLRLQAALQPWAWRVFLTC